MSFGTTKCCGMSWDFETDLRVLGLGNFWGRVNNRPIAAHPYNYMYSLKDRLLFIFGTCTILF